MVPAGVFSTHTLRKENHQSQVPSGLVHITRQSLKHLEIRKRLYHHRKLL